ncbi:MAG: heat-inducible transcription repressor HrcA [Ignavibacteria bacterium GWA2_35_9]|nr:MAG: heat-inducible transcription repressor HrcA [Ignavibacteria bacterium GWA2_35_9]OGU45618.1 MAG: heat-inducible transcription repressor HrcA [Ignavibacteria bacterium GWB2_36_8]OGU49983.1 MAG: heat-inducible transcription repressor HrcA [Ignavibacteria bacterium GWC2_36_12]
MYRELNEREKNILRHIIQQFILTASPVGSRNITKKYEIGLSPATVRNIMSDLEDEGYVDHPHTSAGRVPTDKGYRFYVDSLIDIQDIKSSEKAFIKEKLVESYEADELLKITSVLLSKITHQLACVTYPKLESGVLEKLQLVSLSSTRLLVVISIKSGLVKTITLELSTEIEASKIEPIQNLLNERLSGLTLNEIRKTFNERLHDLIDVDKTSIVRLFYDSVDKIFKDVWQKDNLVISGAKNVIRQPEFEDPERFQSIIELIEDKDIIVHILEKSGETIPNHVFVSIGSENEDEKLNDYSFISKEYKLGETNGTVGIIGPKRMEYSKIIAIIDYMSKMLSEILTSPNVK